MIESRKIKLSMIVALILAASLGVVLFGLSKNKNPIAGKIGYVIPGVPYFSVHNHTGKNIVVMGDTVSAVLSIQEYWNPGKNNYVETYRSIKTGAIFVTGESIRSFFTRAGYAVKEVHLENNELKTYINDSAKTPLFAFLSVDENQSEKDLYHPAVVVIGVKESEQKVIVHDFWLGNNYEISFSDFDQRWSRMRPDEQKNYIIIQPQNLKSALTELGTRKIENYPKRTMTMDRTMGMLKNYALGFGSGDLSNLNSEALDYFSRVEKDSGFKEELPPFFRVMTYYELASAYLKARKFDSALEYALKAVDANHDLDKPSNDWPGYERELGLVNGELSDPWIALGNVYLETKNYQKAKEAYAKSLQIAPDNSEIKDKFRMIDIVLAQSKSE